LGKSSGSLLKVINEGMVDLSLHLLSQWLPVRNGTWISVSYCNNIRRVWRDSHISIITLLLSKHSSSHSGWFYQNFQVLYILPMDYFTIFISVDTDSSTLPQAEAETDEADGELQAGKATRWQGGKKGAFGVIPQSACNMSCGKDPGLVRGQDLENTRRGALTTVPLAQGGKKVDRWILKAKYWVPTLS
jgi:hypothetical protein